MNEPKEEYYENVNYRELLKLQPDDFYLHLPFQIPFTKWIYEGRIQFLLTIGWETNYFGLRHRLEPQVQWFSDWIFLNHYIFDYRIDKKWKPSLIDRYRYQWLMRQGYSKELKHYYDLSFRVKERQVTVQERKFYNKYIECLYFSYFESNRDDELGYFRLGLDVDEPLKNEDKPLFPNIAYSYIDDPRLAYYQNNVMLTEHIPKHNSWFIKYKARKKMTKKWDSGGKVTYADMRVMFNPDTTKIHDLEFLLHCYNKHPNPAMGQEEKKLFDNIHPLYSIEISHIAQTMHIPELEKLKHIFKNTRHLNPLYVAYKQRWIGKNPVKEFDKVFHGVTKEEYQDIVNKQYEHQTKPTKKNTHNKANQMIANKLAEDLLATTLKHR